MSGGGGVEQGGGAELPLTPKRSAFAELTNARSYVSPTANLKLLTAVALHAACPSPAPTPPPGSSTPAGSAQRRDKSLQILCDRFLELYPLYGNEGTVEIQLDTTAAKLGVEKRRMYDIINILEAMQCAVHRRKNTYLWHGGSRMSSFLRMLKKQGEALCLSAALRGKAPKPPAPKHKTLGVLAQRFLMLFLVEPPNTYINLEMAVGVLIDTSNRTNSLLTPDQIERQHKSKVRRLYDIANVLISIGVIEKVSGNLILKKPVFTYVGPIKMKSERVVHITPSPITPVPHVLTPSSHLHGAARSKRKLVFSTPTSKKDLHPKRLLSSPVTPTQKWDEILLVADMELNKINNMQM